MKKQQGALMTKVIFIVLLAAVFVYLGVYALSALSDPFQTTPAVEYTAEEALTLVGWLVREEETVSSSAEYIDVRIEEGEKVGVGQVLARTYDSAEDLERQRRIDELELSLEQLEAVFDSDSDPAAAAKLDQQINEVTLALSRATAEGDLSDVENQVLSLKSLVLSRSEIFSGSSDVSALRQSLQLELTTLLSGASSTGVIPAEHSGLFSTQVDGYEQLLTVEMLDSLDPGDMAALERQSPVSDSDVFGKYIYGIRWYLVALLDESDTALLDGRQTVQMRFTGGYTDLMEMDVVRLSEADSQGRRLLVLSCDHYLSETISLRRQSVEIINEQYSGIRIPQKALRVDESGQTGVYCISGVQAKFKPVEIIYELDNYFIVAQDPSNPSALHVGDEIIVSAKGLYDGKVIG